MSIKYSLFRIKEYFIEIYHVKMVDKLFQYYLSAKQTRFACPEQVNWRKARRPAPSNGDMFVKCYQRCRTSLSKQLFIFTLSNNSFTMTINISGVTTQPQVSCALLTANPFLKTYFTASHKKLLKSCRIVVLKRWRICFNVAIQVCSSVYYGCIAHV